MKNLRIETTEMFNQAIRACWKDSRDNPHKAKMTCVEHLTEQLDLLGYDFVQVTVDVEPLISFA